MSDISDLLARLKSGNTPSASSPSASIHHPQPQTVGYRPPYVTSATASPSVERSGMFSPSMSGSASVRGTTDSPAGDRTANLLNLLKFNQPGANASQRAASANVAPSSMSDLLANRQASSTQQTDATHGSMTGAGTQDLLLKLLNRPQAAQGQNTEVGIEAVPVELMMGSALAAHDDVGTAPLAENSSPSMQQHQEPARGKSPFKAVNPFEQLAASLPSRTKTPEVRPSQQKLPVNLQTDSPAPSPMPDGRSKIEALLGIGAESTPSDSKNATAKNAKQAAADIKAELVNADSRAAIETGMPAAMAKGFEDKLNELAGGPVADNWEAAEAAESRAEASRGVRVYGFPMKPFLAIDVNKLPTATPVRDDIVMKIASLKREFDQIDRTLASATTNFIVYAMTKTGGVRVIRQEDGTNKQVFRGTDNQIFNLSISGASGSGPFGAEAVLATGVNGNVYWTSIPNSADFADEDLDRRGFSFPPLPQADENTSGLQLKTRAKLSNKHPDFFAVARGKSIHIIWPALALEPDYVNKDTRIVDTAKYLDERCLKIATGKAGKDFSFSADDTVIASLDKAGRIKFWDVREHIDPSNAVLASKRNVIVNTPIMVLHTTSSNEKSWATSVTFADKERAISRGQVLRYLLVGSKQNHTLHLWDLVLNKVVQEVNFPHENETDPICSIVYHAKSGIIAVGHPTRNSVFLLHLSLPRHNIPAGLSQAQFMQRLAMKDETIPKAESTAIMSGIRELSLSSIGQLLSLDVVDASSNTSVPEVDDKSLFEIYIMHTRGVTALSPRNQDLGWDAQSKVLYPVDAAAEKIVSIGDLRQPVLGETAPTPMESSSKTESPTVSSPSKRVPSPSKKVDKVAPAASEPRVQTPPTSVLTPVPTTAPTPIPATKNLATKSSEPAAAKTQVSQPSQPPAVSLSNGTAKPAQPKAIPPTNNNPAPVSMPTLGMSTPSDLSGSALDASALAETMSRALASTLSDVLSKVLGDLFENLYRRLDDDKRVNEAAGSAKQDAVLRLVSSTLTDNVEKSLNRIISSTIEKSVLPALSTTVAAAIERKVADAVALQLQSSLSRDLQSALTAPIASAMQDPKVVSTLNDQLTSKVTSHVESVFTTTLNQTITPAFQKLATNSASKMTAEMEKRVGLQVQELNTQRQADGAKIDKLTKITTELVDSVRAMTSMLADSQKEIIGLQAQLAEQLAATSARASAAPARPSDPEVDALEDCWTDGRREEGTIRWLQSTRRVELFDLFFVNCDPAYLTTVNPIVAMSVAACITESMTTHLAERVAWLGAALRAVHDTQDQDTVQNAPKVMDTVIQRLSNEYMALIEKDPGNELLPSFHGLVRQARDLKGFAMLMLSR